MDQNLLKLKNHPAFVHTETITDLCKPLTNLEITTFSHLRLINGKSIAAISTNPVFMENYVRQKYYNADVHADPKHCHLLNCLMWDNIEVKGQTENMLQDAADFQFRHIFTMIKQQPSYTDFYHFGTHLNSISINQMYVNQLDLLEKFIAYFNTAVNQSFELKSAYDIQFELDKNIQTFDAGEGAFLVENGQRNQFLSTIGEAGLNLNFTARELEFVPMIIRGLTAKEIGIILGISYRTVEDYLASLKNKLQARNKVELVSKLCSLVDANGKI